MKIPRQTFGARLLGALSLLLIPKGVYALSFVQVAELFNIFVGLMLTAAILIFFGGLSAYFARFGTWPSYRDGAIKVMEWGVVTLFVLIVILVIVQFFQKNTALASAIAVGVILAVAAGGILYMALQSKESEK